MQSLSRMIGGADDDDGARQRAADGSLPAQHDPGLSGPWRDRNGRVRVLRPQPAARGAAFLLAAGLEQALDFLENLRFPAADIDWLASTGRFGDKLIDYLARRSASPATSTPCREGTVFFANEPILRVTAPLPQAQLVEIAADQHPAFSVADRRQGGAHGAGRAGQAAGRFRPAARAWRRGRADGGARELSSPASPAPRPCWPDSEFGIPLYGTMAHSFIQAFDDETAASRPSRTSRPDNLVLLLDTYDTEAAARKVVALAPRLKAAGITIRGVRLDQRRSRSRCRAACARILDAGGLARRDDLRQRRPRRRCAGRPSPAPARRSTASASAPA